MEARSRPSDRDVSAFGLNAVPLQTNSAVPCVVVLQHDLFLPRTFVMQCIIKLVDCLEVTDGIDGVSLWQKLVRFEFFRIARGSSRGPADWGPCSRRLFVLLEPAVVTLHGAVQKIVAFDFVLLQHLRGIRFCVREDVSCPLAIEEPNHPSLRTFDRSWTAPRFCCSLSCHILACYTSILADDVIGFGVEYIYGFV